MYIQGRHILKQSSDHYMTCIFTDLSKFNADFCHPFIVFSIQMSIPIMCSCCAGYMSNEEVLYNIGLT